MGEDVCLVSRQARPNSSRVLVRRAFLPHAPRPINDHWKVLNTANKVTMWDNIWVAKFLFEHVFNLSDRLRNPILAQ